MTLPVEAGAGVDPRAEAPRKGRRARRVLRPIGSLLIVAGLGVMAWSAVVVFWQDPFTALYAHRAQRSLEADYTTLVQSYRLPAVVRGHGGLLPVRARAAVAAEFGVRPS